jgi:hypothetical protein
MWKYLKKTKGCYHAITMTKLRDASLFDLGAFSFCGQWDGYCHKEGYGLRAKCDPRDGANRMGKLFMVLYPQ